MPQSRLAADTDKEVERVQIAGWRNMSPAQKAEIVSGLTTAVYKWQWPECARGFRTRPHGNSFYDWPFKP